MKTYAVPEQLANAIMQYLGKQPYVEVAGLIAQLAQVQELSAPPAAVVQKEQGD